MKNIIDVRGHLRTKREAEAAQAAKRIYRRFICNTIDLIYAEPPIKPCCENSWSIEIVHVARALEETAEHHKNCWNLSENTIINDIFSDHFFSYDQTNDGNLHFKILEFADTDVARLVICRDHFRFDREIPREIKSTMIKAAKLEYKLIALPSFESFISGTNSQKTPAEIDDPNSGFVAKLNRAKNFFNEEADG